MIRTNFSLALLVLLFLAQQCAPLNAQEALQQQIRDIAKDAQGKVSVACSLPGTALNCDVDALSHPPMQSVFKLPLAVAVLHQVEEGKFSLDQPIRFRKEDLILPKPYSPLQDEYPAADVDVALSRLLQLNVGLSDNTAADVLLRLAGGPSVVKEYIASLPVKGFHLEDGDRELHRDVQAQYRNWFEPEGAVQLLRTISDHSPLTTQHTSLLLGWMQPAIASFRPSGKLTSPISLNAWQTPLSTSDVPLLCATMVPLGRAPSRRPVGVAGCIHPSSKLVSCAVKGE